MPGYECLLRFVCEVSGSNFEHNGVLGDLLELILKPSMSKPESSHLVDSILEAERLGEDGECSKFKKDCSKSLLDEMSHFFD